VSKRDKQGVEPLVFMALNSCFFFHDNLGRWHKYCDIMKQISDFYRSNAFHIKFSFFPLRSPSDMSWRGTS